MKKKTKPEEDLFSSISSTSSKMQKPIWNLVTNDRNLFYILAAGLILPPKGFLEKYYQDVLSLYPGWIPLINGSVPSSFVQKATSERDWLKPCIVTINLDNLSGDVYSINEHGEISPIKLPCSDLSDCVLLLVPAPLPAYWIEAITFVNKEDKDACLAKADDLSNVPLKQYNLKTNASAFKMNRNINEVTMSFSEKNYDESPDKSLAYGAMLAMLSNFSEKSSLASKICNIAFSPLEHIKTTEDPILYPLNSWIMGDLELNQMDDVPAKIFWGVVDHLASCRSKADSSTSLDELLDYLRSVSAEPKVKERLNVMIKDVTEVTGFGDSSISELFKRNKGSLSRAIITFALRDNCSGLIQFSREEALEEGDLVLAAILFAARDNWMGLPLGLRGTTKNMIHAIEHRMATMAQRHSGSGIDLGEAPSRPKQLHELFLFIDKQWNTKQKNAALNLVRGMKWDCIKTKITLDKGAYQIQIDGKGLQIEIDGDFKGLDVSVEPVQFLEKLSTETIKPQLIKQVYQDLGEEPTL